MNKDKRVISYGTVSKQKPYQGVLTSAQIAVGINFAHENGLRLLEDARQLFNNERYPSAVTLALLAVEEFSKELILRKMAVKDSNEQVQNFWVQMRNHRTKAAVGALPELFKGGLVDLVQAAEEIEAPEAAYGETFNWLKESGLYIECVQNGKWLRPIDQIDGELAKSILTNSELMAGTGNPYPVTKEQIDEMQALAKDPRLSRAKIEDFAKKYSSPNKNTEK